MSIVAMKNKSRGYNKPISGKQYVGFALNGTLRNQGYVGQESTSRKIIKTPFKGNYPVGHGGHLGKYVVNTIFSCNSSNDPNIIKKSTKNNIGHIYSSLLYPTSKCSINTNTIAKDPPIIKQSDYIKSLRMNDSCDNSNTSEVKTILNNGNTGSKVSGGPSCGNYAKHTSSLSSGEYMSALIYKKNCISDNVAIA